MVMTEQNYICVNGTLKVNAPKRFLGIFSRDITIELLKNSIVEISKIVSISM
ncbi:hypothetical protein LEP1GSC127_1724 [Leptospira kirschneri str. 200801925]|nr:hypothetical protein LEP1GSC042_3764 [Leptospira kirschneri serovar Bim str. PUO 1247]EMN03119.1 hypothetical protein LEP1GSC046_1984 [Leptospira kirschneri serovar Bim str. 1051]EMN26629.1 hypothetical protein LEP1GSC065_2780 [Leptospira kirschneri serovar Sokoine str. RM1]EMO75602.1 hypothetical protein LEP1GSC127_1724 [Leptospira kirschneri str. 200801925]